MSPKKRQHSDWLLVSVMRTIVFLILVCFLAYKFPDDFGAYLQYLLFLGK